MGRGPGRPRKNVVEDDAGAIYVAPGAPFDEEEPHSASPSVGIHPAPPMSSSDASEKGSTGTVNPTHQYETRRAAQLQKFEEKEAMSELDLVEAEVARRGIGHLWEMLPLSTDLFFGFNDSPTDKNTRHLFRMKMFLGGDHHVQAWAYLREHETKSSEVHIFLEARNLDSTITTRELIGKELKGVNFMYPFEVLRRIYISEDANWARPQLNVLIQVYFLEARKIDRVWAEDGCAGPIKTLMGAIKTIAEAYSDFPNGVEDVPNTFMPPSLIACPMNTVAPTTHRPSKALAKAPAKAPAPRRIALAAPPSQRPMREPTNPGRRIAPTYPPLRDLPDVDTTADTRSATAQLAEDLLQDVSRSMRETSIQDSPEATAARRKANEALANLNEAAANLAAEAQKESAIDKRFKAMEAEYMAFKERSRQRQIEYQEQMSEAMMYIRPP